MQKLFLYLSIYIPMKTFICYLYPHMKSQCKIQIYSINIQQIYSLHWDATFKLNGLIQDIQSIAYKVPKTPLTKCYSKVIIKYFASTSIKNENFKQNEKFQKYS